MSILVDLIVDGNYTEAKRQLEEEITSIAQSHLHEFKRQILDELNRTHRGKVDLVNVRVKDGKIIRHSTIRNKIRGKGYELKAGKLHKMGGSEMANRRAGARRSKVKRRSQINRILRKRYKSLKLRYNAGGP